MMTNVSIHLLPFIEIVAAAIAAPLASFYVWRGRRRRRLANRPTSSTPTE